MSLLVPILLFILGFVLLIKGGDWFVDGASSIAHRFHLPELLIGATVVSIGTTLPEVMVSATSAVSGNGSIAYGNAIGSIICNTSLIAALTVAIRPGNVVRKTLISPVIFFFVSAGFYAVVAYTTRYFSRTTGIILLVIFVVYMVFTVLQMKNSPQEETAAATEETTASDSVVKDIILLVVGAAVIAVGARLLVDNGTKIAEALGVPDAVIALTFVALGTSLPELVTAITSLIKGHSSLSLGNVIGANLFNLVLVSGVSSTIAPFHVPEDSVLEIGGKTLNASLALDIPLMLFVMLLLTIPALIRGKLSRFQGIILLAIYASYCIFQFVK